MVELNSGLHNRWSRISAHRSIEEDYVEIGTNLLGLAIKSMLNKLANMLATSRKD